MSTRFETRIGPGYVTSPTFEGMHFPAGEAHIKVINENDGKGELTEIARVNTPTADDLIMLGMWADACWQRRAKSVALIPYLPGARQDRGIPFGADVYARIINSFQINQIISFDTHSPVILKHIYRTTHVTAAHFIRQHVVGRADSDERAQRYQGIIAPDKGSVPRATELANICHLPLYRAEKHRDEATGKLSGFSMIDPLPDTGRLLIADDICDGGGTFMGLATATGLPKERLGLFVSHGVFSGKAPALADYFGEIVTTDSYTPQTEIPGLRILPLDKTLTGAIK